MSPRRNVARFAIGIPILVVMALFAFTRTRGVLQLSELREMEASDVQVVRVSPRGLRPGVLAPITNPSEIERLLGGLRGARRSAYDHQRLKPLLRLTIVSRAGDEYEQRFFRKAGDERRVFIEGGLHDYLLESEELEEFVRRALDSTRKNYE